MITKSTGYAFCDDCNHLAVGLTAAGWFCKCGNLVGIKFAKISFARDPKELESEITDEDVQWLESQDGCIGGYTFDRITEFKKNQQKGQ